MLERIQALEAAVNALEAKMGIDPEAKESKPWEPWKPKDGEMYWYTHSTGSVRACLYVADTFDEGCYDYGNCFPTPEAAERYALRIRSMRPTCPVPKVGDTVYVLAFGDGSLPTYTTHTWRGRALDRYYYNRGVIFASIEALDSWVAEFGEAWATLEDEA